MEQCATMMAAMGDGMIDDMMGDENDGAVRLHDGGYGRQDDGRRDDGRRHDGPHDGQRDNGRMSRPQGRSGVLRP